MASARGALRPAAMPQDRRQSARRAWAAGSGAGAGARRNWQLCRSGGYHFTPMAEHSIPDEVGRFILTSIPSVPYLEAILLLQRETGAAWNPSQLARRLYLPEAQAGQLLQTLEAAGVAAKDPAAQDAWRYMPAPELAAMLEQVARHYSTDLFAVTTLIHSRLDKRAFQFADAFRWRKDS
jgi:hypothetical protein